MSESYSLNQIAVFCNLNTVLAKFVFKMSFIRFSRATLCVNAVFAVARCPSVPLVYCIQVAEDIVKLLFRPGSSIILVFWHQAPVPNSKVNPFIGGVKYTGVGKICGFRLKSPFISETVRDGHRSVSVPMTLSDLERRDARGQMFQADLLNNTRIVWPRTTKFGRITRKGWTYF